MNIDLYEMTYRNYKYYEKRKPDTNINISAKTKKSVTDTIKILMNTEIKIENLENPINFSDIICYDIPIFDEKTHNLSYRKNFMFNGEKKDINPIEYIKRFNNFDINNLPLIEVAKYLNIIVEKLSALGSSLFGQFSPNENKITLGTDYPPIFIHELAHAIHFIFLESSGTTKYEEAFNNLDDIEDIQEYFLFFSELVAEFTTVVLCRIYNIPINISYAIIYICSHLNNYNRISTNVNNLLITDITKICEYVNKCIENIEEKRRFL